jgi:hypothetical protein
VVRLGLIEGRLHWKQAVSEAKAAGEISNSAGIFVSRLAQDREFDAVVMPSLIMIQKRMDSSAASWDGVSRRLKTSIESSRAPGRQDSAYSTSAGHPGFSGPAWVTSLHVLVFARDGSRVFEGRGGIDFAHQIDVVKVGRNHRAQFGPNRSIFTDREILREGVRLAFTPYLGPPDE